MHIQILALFLPSEQKAAVSNTEHTLEVLHLTRNNLINNRQKKLPKASLKEALLRHHVTKEK